jgi:hypothetical protein
MLKKMNFRPLFWYSDSFAVVEVVQAERNDPLRMT